MTPRRLRDLAFVLALAVLLGALPALAKDRPYRHVWQAVGLAGGDRGGSTGTRVLVDEMTMRLDGGSFVGRIRYADRLLIESPGGDLGQVAELSIDLTGAQTAAGGGAGGGVEGTATVWTVKEPSARFLDETDKPQAEPVTYRLTGTWGARIEGRTASGDLLFESAEVNAEREGVMPVAWFNPFDSSGQGLEAHAFEVEVDGMSRRPQSAAVADSPDANGGLSFFDYVRRGAGGEGSTVLPLPESLAAPARSLAEARPMRATRLPASAVVIDVDVAGAYLDRKNAVAPPSQDTLAQLRETWVRARREGPGRPALEPGQDAFAYYRAQLLGLLGARSVEGGRELREDVELAAAGSPEDVPVLAAYTAAARSLQSTAVADAGLSEVAETARALANAPVPDEQSAALLAVADDPSAPAEARDVTRFELQDPKARQQGRLSLPARLARTLGDPPQLTWMTASGPRAVAAETLVPYVQPGGVTYYLAQPSQDVAVTEGGRDGWAFTTKRAYLVDATRVGRILAVYPLP